MDSGIPSVTESCTVNPSLKAEAILEGLEVYFTKRIILAQ